MKYIVTFITLCIFSCSSDNAENAKPTIFLKAEVSRLSTCVLHHEECSDVNIKCVEAPESLGGTRQCIPQDQLGKYFGCTFGELIIHPMSPWTLDCLDTEIL